MHLTKAFHGTPLSNIRGLGIYFDKAGETTPIVFSQFVIKLTAMPDVMIFFHLRPIETPSIAPEDRHTVSRLRIPNCYRLVVRYGYNDEVVTPDLAAVIYEQVRSFIIQSGHEQTLNDDEYDEDDENDAPRPERSIRRRSTGVSIDVTAQGSRSKFDNDSSGLAKTTSSATLDRDMARGRTEIIGAAARIKSPTTDAQEKHDTETELAKLDDAYRHKVLYIVGKEQMKIKASTGYIRGTLLWAFLWIRDNTRNKIANLKVPTDSLVEVGFLKEI